MIGSHVVCLVVCPAARAGLGISVSTHAGRLEESSVLIKGESSCEVTREQHAILFETQHFIPKASACSAAAGLGNVDLLVVLCMSVGTEQVVHDFLKKLPAHPRARSEVRRYTCSALSLPVSGMDILFGAAAAAAAIEGLRHNICVVSWHWSSLGLGCLQT